MPLIKGGYYLKARKIQQSEIAHTAPHIREIWDWLLKEANHKDIIYCGKPILRGQLLRSYDDIIEGLHWKIGWRKMTYKKWDCEKAMKKLRKLGMIATTKTTRGLFITIVNYSLYQEPKNYESHNESHNESHRLPQTRHTINKNEKNDNNKYICSFEEFWNTYPKRKSKESALRAFQKLNPPPELLKTIIADIQKKKAGADWQKEGGQFIPYPATYLNQKRWEDEEVKQNNNLDHLFYG